MIWTIARKEFLLSLLTFRFSVGLVLCLIAVGAGTLSVMQDYEYRRAAYQKAVDEYQRQLREETPFCWTVDGLSSYRTPRKLSVFSVGTDRWQGQVVFNSIHLVPDRAERLGATNPYLAIFRSIDLSLVVQVVLGLLAILFAHDVISGEREDGTLRLLLSNAVPRDTVLLGKVVGGLLVLGTLLLASFLLALFVALSGQIIDLRAHEIAKLGALIVVSALYLMALYSIGLYISTSTTRSATSLVVAVFVWLSTVAAYPSAVAYSVDQLLPQAEIARRGEARVEQLEDEFAERSESLAMRVLGSKNYRHLFTRGSGGSSPHRLGSVALAGDFRMGPDRRTMEGYLRFWQVSYTEQDSDQELVAKLKRKAVEAGYDVEHVIGFDPPEEIAHSVRLICSFLERQQPLRVEYADRVWMEGRRPLEERARLATDLVRYLAMLSPAGAFSDAAAIVAQTDQGDYWRFLEATRDYRRELIRHLDEEGLWASREWFNMQAERRSLSLPHFHEPVESVWSALRRAVPNLVVLGAFNLVAFLGTYRRFRRYEVSD